MDDNLITLLKKFEGIIGTLLGIVVGTLISFIQNNTGKIKVYFEHTKYKFDEYGSFKTFKKTEEDIVWKNRYKSFDFSSDIELYNSSNTRNILRFIRLCIETDKGKEYINLYLEDHNLLNTLNLDPNSIVTFPGVYASLTSSDEKKIFLYIEQRKFTLFIKMKKEDWKKCKL